MTDYRAIMTLLIKQRSYRQIEQQLGCSHRVIARANHTLRTCGFSTVEQVAALTDNELDELGPDPLFGGHLISSPVGLGRKVNYHYVQVLRTVQTRCCGSL